MKLEIEIIEIPCKDYDSEKLVWKGSSYEKLISDEKLDLEQFVREHFLGLGYTVIRGKDYNPKFRREGAPDFYVEKDGHGFFVEVKSWAASKVFDRFREMYGTVKCFEIQEKLFGRSINFFKDKDAEWWYENGGLDKCPGVCAVAARLAAEELFRLRVAK